MGAAHARLVFSPDLLQQMPQTFLRLRDQAPEEQSSDPLEPWLGPLSERFGGGGFAEDMAVGQWTIDTVPADARFPLDVRRVPMRYVPYNGPATVPGWLHEPPAGPRVCPTAGTTLRNQAGHDAFPIGDLQMFDAPDIELIATLKQVPGEEEAVPANTRLVDVVPLSALLPSCSAVVHYSGGTWNTALGAGVPQLLVANTWFARRRPGRRPRPPIRRCAAVNSSGRAARSSSSGPAPASPASITEPMSAAPLIPRWRSVSSSERRRPLRRRSW